MNNNSTFFFLKQLLFHPSKVGALLPSSSSLKNVIVEFARQNLRDHELVEIGPGTGAFTFDLERLALEKEVQFSVVEINKEFYEYLKVRLSSRTNLLNICSSELSTYKDLMRPYLVISSIPLKSLDKRKSRDILNTFNQILQNNVDSLILQYSYGTQPPPLPDTKEASLCWVEVQFIFRNMPPATLWKLEKCT